MTASGSRTAHPINAEEPRSRRALMAAAGGAAAALAATLATPVDLRHTHATLALAAGIHPKVVQERLGHSSVTMTLDLYSHAVPGMQADAAATIAALHDAIGA